MPPAPQSQASIRLALNLKNLRRHDASITDIVGSASYATAYWNVGGDWEKTNIEGPMFLFSRSREPKYGFFILNRNGLENILEDLTAESEVRMEGEFILFEPFAEAERATGIWVFEEAEREKLCSRMNELCRMAAAPVRAPVPQLAPKQATPLDFLFASSPPPLVVPNGTNLLDQLFARAPVSAPSPALSAQHLPTQHSRDSTALLHMLGIQPPVAANPVRQPDPPSLSLPVLVPSSKSPMPSFAPPLISHDVFSALPTRRAAPERQVPPHVDVIPLLPVLVPTSTSREAIARSITTAKVPGIIQLPTSQQSIPQQQSNAGRAASNGHVAPSQSQSRSKSRPQQTSSPASATGLSRDLALELISDGLVRTRLGMPVGETEEGEELEPMDKGEFKKAVLELMSKPSFMTALYSGYLNRIGGLMEERGH